MVKVNVHKEGSVPSEQGGGAKTRTTVTDARGRKIEVKKLGPLDRMKAGKAAGAENSRIESYMAYTHLALSLVAIDGVPEGTPQNEIQIEALVERLGQEGIDAIGEAYKEFNASEEAERDPALIKN